VIIDNRLLILGGFTNTTGSYELFYLNLLKPFDNNNLTWTLIPDGNLTVYVYRSTSILSMDNSTIYLIGGVKTNQNGYYDFSKPFYTYNYSINKWDAPKIIGNEVPIRQSIEG
ncbi:12418_t:CDS:1, partial [Dentiscutata erythropus]